MGEYATYNGNQIKIGTCESMYYLRYEDRDKVRQVHGSLDPAKCTGLFWRIPFPDEDANGPGSYDDYNRGERLIGFNLPDDNHGIMQVSHESGLLLNIPCYHGNRLPDVVKPMQAFWNGRDPHCAILRHVKNTDDQGLMPVVACRWCRDMWRYEWAEVLPHVHDKELLKRLEDYQVRFSASR